LSAALPSVVWLLLSVVGCCCVDVLTVSTCSTSWLLVSLISCTAYSWDAHDTFSPFICIHNDTNAYSHDTFNPFICIHKQ